MGRIASTVLAIAKEREAKRLKDIEEAILNALQEIREERLKACESWEMGVGYNFSQFAELDFKYEDIKEIFEGLGFVAQQMGKEIKLTVPKNVNGQNETFAQNFISEFNNELEKRIKAEEAKAKEECDKVFEILITDERFESNKKITGTTCWGITIEVKYSGYTAIFINKAKEILSEEGFQELIIDENKGVWYFQLTENQ